MIAAMQPPAALEVTITHNLGDPAEVEALFSRRLVALDWDRKGPDPNAYTGRARTDVTLFHQMKTRGAAVLAAYKGATPRQSDRLVGWVEAGTEFVRFNELLCLPLSKVQTVDSSVSFFGNLAPRSCTVQTCHNRARGRLAAFVMGTSSVRSVWSLHHLDVEWLVTNFLLSEGLCASVWSGGRSYEDIDHAGYGPTGREVLAQTTVSTDLVGKKADRLRKLRSGNRDLLMFGPESAANRCAEDVEYHAIEKVFEVTDARPAGRWLIDRMLTVGAPQPPAPSEAVD